MRLAALYINGFGLFRNLKIETLSPSLTVILGMNETGKSTLLAFLRAILFGFPDRRSSENLYPPLAGGRHGGNLDLITDDERRYVVERYPGPRGGRVSVLKPDHRRGGKEFLGQLLGMANKTLFKNIYAFSLSELQNFETLNTESIREALYSAGAGIDPHALARLKSSLEKREGELYKRGGSKPRINAILPRLGTISKEKRALAGTIEEYDRIMSRISHLTREIHDLEEKKRNISIQLKNTEQWINIWPEWVNLSMAQEKLKELEPIGHFPLQGLRRFETLKTRFKDLQKELLKKEEDLRRQESQWSALEIDLQILNQGSAIGQLQRGQGHFEAVLEELISLKEQISTGEQRLKEGLKRLGPLWTEEKILEFDLSIAAREEVRSFRETLRAVKLEEQKGKNSLDLLTSKKREAEELLRSLPEPAHKDPKGLAERKESCQDLKRRLSQAGLLREQMGHAEERLQDLREEKRVLEENLTSGNHGLPLWLGFIMLIAGLIFLIWFALKPKHAWAVSLGGLLVIGGLYFWFSRSSLQRRWKEKERRVKQRIQYLKVKEDELERSRSRFDNQLASMTEHIDESCSVLSMSQVPSREDLERMEEENAARINELDCWLRATEGLAVAAEKYEEGLKGLQRVEAEAVRILNRWQKWLKDRGLDPVLTPDGALETLSLIEAFREQVDRLGQLRTRKAFLEETKEKFVTLANEVLATCQREPVGDEEVKSTVQGLVQEFLEMEHGAQEKALLMKEIEASRKSTDRIQRQTSRLRKDIQDLLSSAEVEDEEQFRHRALIYEKRIAIEADMERYKDSIKRLSTKLGGFEGVRETLSTMGLDELEERKTELERELKEIESLLDETKKKQATLEEQARRLVREDKISSLRAEEEGLKEQLSCLAEEWISLRLAHRLMTTARARYQMERQPEVIREAGRFFSRLTLGKYSSVVAPIGEKRIEVLCHDNTRKEIGELSRGTAEQLYLSLRFGFIREFSKATESLPIIMDEILVNFDPERVRATAEAIVELSREYQILFFTCHPHMAAVFRGIDPQIPLIEIREGGVRV